MALLRIEEVIHRDLTVYSYDFIAMLAFGRDCRAIFVFLATPQILPVGNA